MSTARERRLGFGAERCVVPGARDRLLGQHAPVKALHLADVVDLLVILQRVD